MSRGRGVNRHLPIITVGSILAVIITTIILHLPIAIIRASRAGVTVTSVVAIILAGRVITTAARRWRTPSTARRAAFTTSTTLSTLTTTLTTAVTSGIEAPRGRGRSTSPLDLQQVISANTLVVHLMIGIICIATTLVLNESEQTASCSAGSWDVTADKTPISFEFVGKVASASAVPEAGHVESGSSTRHDELNREVELSGRRRKRK